MAWLRDRDWWAMRSPGSFGSADVIAMRPGDRPRMVEVKSTAAGPFAHFGPAARAALIGTADLAGAEAWLVWWPPRQKEPIWLGPEAWPQANRPPAEATVNHPQT